MTKPRMGRVQLRIMQLLWDRGRMTARELTDALNEEREIAHSTVQTLLRKLEAKGAVGHEAQGRSFTFFATVESEDVIGQATDDLVDGAFAGRASNLVMYLLKREKISDRELTDIRALLDQYCHSSFKLS